MTPPKNPTKKPAGTKNPANPGPAASKKPAAEAAPPVDTSPLAAQRIDYAACFRRFLPEAKALPGAQVEVCRAAPRVALVNVKIGLSNIPASDADLHAALPELPLDETRGLADLARALVYAGKMVPLRQASPREIEKQLAIVGPLREQMLDHAELLAKRKLLDADVVQGIRAGSGKYDMAEDGVALAALFTDNAARIANTHPFSAEEIEALREASTWLLESLTPMGARKPAALGSGEAAEHRDRLWTLLQRRHVWLRVAGFYYHHDAFETKTPRLQSRVSDGALSEEEEPEDPEGDGKK